LGGGSLDPRRCIREYYNLYLLKLSLIFLGLNNAYECPIYIINPSGLAEATEEGSTHFGGRDYQYCYYFFYASNFNSHPSLNTRWSYYHSSNFEAASLSSSINFQRVKGTVTRALRGCSILCADFCLRLRQEALPAREGLIISVEEILKWDRNADAE
jgi:hypothetical protein